MGIESLGIGRKRERVEDLQKQRRGKVGRDRVILWSGLYREKTGMGEGRKVNLWESKGRDRKIE